ncbi:MAG: DAK2 domain-containing protein [Clostridia bacterium]|nr:DAK2 domain-containing protein [Clostridia bacterium]
MMSRVGRSRNFAEETLGIPDPGAVSISLFFRGLSEWARKRA